MDRRISIIPFMLAAGLLCLCTPRGRGQDAEPNSSPVAWPGLKSEFPKYAAFSGEVRTYAYRQEPYHAYRKPDFEKWLEDAGEEKEPKAGEGFIEAGYEEGSIRYVRVVSKDGSGTFYWIEGDTIELVQPTGPEGRLFLTEVGVYRWKRTYSKGLLVKTVSYRQAFPAGKVVYNVETVEYWPGSDKPRRILFFKSESDAMAGEWQQKLDFDENGKPIPMDPASRLP
jgi:hypothetical protein